MGIVAIDSSGTFEQPPIWVVAVRKVNIQKHNVLRLNETQCDDYKKRIAENWREKVSAACMFKCLEPLIKHSDIIQIDKDFLGWRKDYVERYLKRLFGKKFYGKYPLSNPKIQFIPDEYSDDVTLAHRKTQSARRKGIKVYECPDLGKLLQWLE